MDFDLDDLISSDAANNAKASKKFQPKAKPKPKPKAAPTPSTQFVETAATANNECICRTEEELPRNDIDRNTGNTSEYLGRNPDYDAVDLQPLSEAPTSQVSMDENLERGSAEPELNNSIDAFANLGSFAQIDPLTGEEAAIVNDNGDFHVEHSSIASKDAESSVFWESLDVLSYSKFSTGPKVGKFKPKPKAQTRKAEQIADTPDQDVVSVQYEDNIHSVPSQTNFVENECVPSFTSDEILGSPSIRVTDSVLTDTIPDYHVNEEPINLAENSQVDSFDRGGISPERSKRRSNKTLELIDELEDEGIDHDIVHRTESNNHDGDYGPEIESSIERKGSESKKPTNEKKKAGRKRKKANEVTEELTEPPKKKFSHSTRRYKRQVDPELLKIPEDELELHMHHVPMRELVRLAEHRERIAKKEASTSGTPAMNQSFSNHDEQESLAQGMGSPHEHNFSREAQNATYYNYGTHMKKTSRMKWSNQETELFFEAIQEFGTDLSLITQRFPGRTRNQIKSKFKIEERQQPLRLNDALTTPATGYSHFEVVIERLTQAEAQDSENEDPTTLTDVEDGMAADLNEGVGLEKEVKDMEDDIPDAAAAAAAAVESAAKSDDSEDDMYRWSQYKSEI